MTSHIRFNIRRSKMRRKRFHADRAHGVLFQEQLARGIFRIIWKEEEGPCRGRKKEGLVGKFSHFLRFGTELKFCISTPATKIVALLFFLQILCGLSLDWAACKEIYPSVYTLTSFQ